MYKQGGELTFLYHHSWFSCLSLVPFSKYSNIIMALRLQTKKKLKPKEKHYVSLHIQKAINKLFATEFIHLKV